MNLTISTHEVPCDESLRAWLHETTESAFAPYAAEINSLQLVLARGTDPTNMPAVRGIIVVNAPRFPIVAMEVTGKDASQATVFVISLAVNALEGHCEDLGLAPNDPVVAHG